MTQQRFCAHCGEFTNHYSSGCVPCKRRRNADYRAENREKVRAQKAEAYAENREKIRAQRREAYTKDREKILAANAEYRAQNREKLGAQRAKKYAENREKIRAQRANKYAEKREQIRAQRANEYAENRDKYRARRAENYAKNAGKILAHNSERRAARLQQRCGCCEDLDIQWSYDIRPEQYEVDHIIPLRLGGHHCARNLQVLTRQEHKEKTARDRARMTLSARINRAFRAWRAPSGAAAH